MTMADKNRVLNFIHENNGVIRAKDVRQMDMDTKVLQRLEKSGDLERVAHGLYMDAEHLEDPFLVAQYRCSKGVFSMDTALYLHQLSDRNPVKLSFTIPSGWNTALLTESSYYRFFYLKENLWKMGQSTIVSAYGNTLTVYSVERTICDCIRKINELDRDEVLSAVKIYMKRPDAKWQELMNYAELFHIRKTVRQYMEVLQ